MGSTLRSLVLAYKADTKDFRKGSESVKAEIRAVKDHVGAMDKQLAKSFGKVEPITRMRNEIRQLSAAYQQGAISLRAYGDATDKLRDRIKKIQINRDLRGAFGGSMTESREAIMSRMGGIGGGGGSGGGAMGQMSGNLVDSLIMSSPYSHLLPGKTKKALQKYGKPAGFALATAFSLNQMGNAADEMASSTDARESVTGQVVGSAWTKVKKGLSVGIWKKGAEAIGAGADFFSGGGITKAVEQQKETLRLEERLDAIREKNRIRDEKIAEAKDRSLEATRKEIAAEQAKRDAIEGSLTAMREEAAVGELMATGMGEAAARMKVAGGTSDDVKNAGFLAAKIQAQRDAAIAKNTRGEDFNAMLGTGVEDMFRQAAEQVKAVDAFGKQFDNPVERFKRNAEEIRKMRDMGLSPEIMERAMKANAAAFGGSQGGNFTGANVISGSAESMKLAEQAKIGDRQEEGINKLVKIQEEALRNAKENKPLEINVTNVSI